MAKGQLRGNREAKKPKQQKSPQPATTPGAVPFKGLAAPAAAIKKR